MHKKLIYLAISLAMLCQISFAETCPSVKDIKTQSLTEGWKAYDSDDGQLLPPSRVAQLASHIDQFALAEWADTGRSGGVIHCYYRDKHGSDLEAYFSKDNFKPDNTKNMWYQVSGYMHCAAGMDKCSFQNNMAPEQQLAKN
jgi:hypothetical protein